MWGYTNIDSFLEQVKKGEGEKEEEEEEEEWRSKSSNTSNEWLYFEIVTL